MRLDAPTLRCPRKGAGEAIDGQIGLDIDPATPTLWQSSHSCDRSRLEPSCPDHAAYQRPGTLGVPSRPLVVGVDFTHRGYGPITVATLELDTAATRAGIVATTRCILLRIPTHGLGWGHLTAQ